MKYRVTIEAQDPWQTGDNSKTWHFQHRAEFDSDSNLREFIEKVEQLAD